MANGFWAKILHKTNNEFNGSIVTLQKLINVPFLEFKNSLEALHFLSIIPSLVALMHVIYAYYYTMMKTVKSW